MLIGMKFELKWNEYSSQLDGFFLLELLVLKMFFSFKTAARVD